MTEVKLSRLYPVLDAQEYPLTKNEALQETENITLKLADGTVNLATVIEDSSENEFNEFEDLLLEVMMLLPRRAVGEPFQSEGDA